MGSQSFLAEVLLSLGRLEEAFCEAERAEAVALQTLGPEHITTLAVWESMGQIVAVRGDRKRGLALLRRVAVSRENRLGPLDPSTIGTLGDIARILAVDGQLDEARRLWSDVVERSARVYGLSHIACSYPMGQLFAVLRQLGDYPAIRDLCEGWIRELLAMPPETDRYERDRHSLRLSVLALELVMLPEPIRFDGSLAVRAAEQAAERGNDTQDNNWTRLSLVHLRLGHAERAEWAVRESMKRCEGDCFDSMTQALIHARRGELKQARAWVHQAVREHGRDGGPPGEGYEQVRNQVAAPLEVSDASADALARP